MLHLKNKIIGVVLAIGTVASVGIVALNSHSQNVMAQAPRTYLSVFTSMSQPTKDRVFAAFGDVFSYQDEIPDEEGEMIPNPESLETFAERQLELWVRKQMITSEGRVARNDAYDLVVIDVNDFDF